MLETFKKYIQEHTNITDEQFSRIATGITVKDVKKKTVLLRQEDVCSSVFFISQGLLRSYTIDNDGKEHILQFAPENWWIADRDSFYFNTPSLFFVDAIEDSQVLLLNDHFFSTAEDICPAFVKFNIRALHNSIRFMQRRINALLSATAEERYLEFIELYPSLTLRVSQWMIASYLGITAESLSRVRKELANRHMEK